MNQNYMETPIDSVNIINQSSRIVRGTSGLKPKLVSSFATAYLGCSVNSQSIGLTKPINNAKHMPNHIMISLRDPRATVYIHNSGNMRIITSKGPQQAKKAATIAANKCKNRGYPLVKLSKFKICNITTVFTLPWGVKLEALKTKYPHCTSYEPELFPGIEYKFTDSTTFCRIFHTGKVVLCGSKSEDLAIEAFEKVYVVLNEFKRNPLSCCEKRNCNFSIRLKRI